MAKYLLCDVGSTFTKLCLVDTESFAVLGTSACPTTIGEDVNIGLGQAVGRLGADASDVRATLVCSSAAGGLKIVAVGLVPQLTLEAARMAALGAGGKIVGAFGYRLTDDDLVAMARLAPDLILLSGGTDGGDRDYILHNARRLAASASPVPIVVAGNRAAVDDLRVIFADRTDVGFAENVLPELGRLNFEPARRQIRTVFLERIVSAKGLDRLQQRARVLMPTPEAVFRAARLLSQGAHGKDGLGELLIVDIGGATTDVYSCASGLPSSPATVQRGLVEPFDKRTVEADVGMRHTLRYLAELVDIDSLARQADVSADQVKHFVDAFAAEPSLLPRDPAEARIDRAFAYWGCRIAVTRHAGRISETYTPQGRLFIQEGKDLSGVPTVIGTGGPLVHSEQALAILAGCCRDGDPTDLGLCATGGLSASAGEDTGGQAASGTRTGEDTGGQAASGTQSMGHLLPIAPRFFVDRDYLLWAMGLLAEEDPAAALAIMRQHLGPALAPSPSSLAPNPGATLGPV